MARRVRKPETIRRPPKRSPQQLFETSLEIRRRKFRRRRIRIIAGLMVLIGSILLWTLLLH